MDISNDQFSGMLPTWMGNNSGLPAIDLSEKSFWGSGSKWFLQPCGPWVLFGHVWEQFVWFYTILLQPAKYQTCPFIQKSIELSINKRIYNSSSLVTLDLTNNNFMGPISNWIGNLSALSVLLLWKLIILLVRFLLSYACLLEQFSIFDVSQNKLTGGLPSCLRNHAFKENWEKAVATRQYSITFESLREMYSEIMDSGSIDYVGINYRFTLIEEVIEFTTKKMPYGYKGNILNFMSGSLQQ